MSNQKQIRKLEKKLKQLRKIVKKDCLTITNSANDNESITISFVNNIVQIKKIIKSEETKSVEISEITFN